MYLKSAHRIQMNSFCHASSQFLRLICLNKAAETACVQSVCVWWSLVYVCGVQLSCMPLFSSSHPILSLPLAEINRPNKMVFKNRLIASQVYFCNCYMGNKWDEALRRERSMTTFMVLYYPLEEPRGQGDTKGWSVFVPLKMISTWITRA